MLFEILEEPRERVIVVVKVATVHDISGVRWRRGRGDIFFIDLGRITDRWATPGAAVEHFEEREPLRRRRAQPPAVLDQDPLARIVTVIIEIWGAPLFGSSRTLRTIRGGLNGDQVSWVDLVVRIGPPLILGPAPPAGVMDGRGGEPTTEPAVVAFVVLPFPSFVTAARLR